MLRRTLFELFYELILNQCSVSVCSVKNVTLPNVVVDKKTKKTIEKLSRKNTDTIFKTTVNLFEIINFILMLWFLRMNQVQRLRSLQQNEKSVLSLTQVG